MKKRIFPICLSFLFSIAFLAVGIYFTYCFVKEPVRNFAMLWIPQSIVSAGIYAALGVLLCANKLNKITAVALFAVAFLAAVGPLAFIIFSFAFFLLFPFGLETFLLFFAPIFPCALPLVMIFTAKD